MCLAQGGRRIVDLHRNNNNNNHRQQTTRVFVPAEWRQLKESAAIVDSHATTISLTFALKQNNVQLLQEIVEAVSNPKSKNYGKYLTVEELTDIVAPDDEVIEEVVAWLASHGISDLKLTHNKDFIVARMSIAQAEALLSTQFHAFENDEGIVIHRAVQRRYSVPKSIERHLDFIGNVHNFPRSRTIIEPAAADATASVKTTPALIRKIYNINDYMPKSQNNLHAVASFLGQYYSTSDLNKFFASFDLPQYEVERLIGPNDESNPGVEAELDVQYLMGVSQGVRTWVWSTAGLNQDGQEPFLEWIVAVSNTTTEIPNVFSISYQDYEDTIDPSYMFRVNIEFMKIAIRGITLVTGSGDWGTYCNSACNRFVADFPSNSPYIVSTGATQFEGDQSRVGTEVGVSWSSGGFSEVFPQPPYQADFVDRFINETSAPHSYFNAAGRAFPDVSTIGVNFQVMVNGSLMNVGGTSAATPTFASVISYLNDIRLSKGLPTLGHINPFLYEAARQNKGAFTDITSGNNQYGCCTTGFTAIEGWDAITGLGTPNFDVLSQLVLDPTMFPHLYDDDDDAN